MPAPADKAPGDIVYLFQPVNVAMADGTSLSSWEIVDSMVVGMMARCERPRHPILELEHVIARHLGACSLLR